MSDNTSPNHISLDEVEQEFAETLRAAAYIFENERNGRFEGCILACRAVARFIRQRNGGAELAGPFFQIAEAFKELEKGGKPSLFSKKSVTEKERARSPERKHLQKLAAVALEVLVKLGEKRSVAASKIAMHVNKWPGMGVQMVQGQTVIAWRNLHRRIEEKRKSFDTLAGNMLRESDPRKTVADLLCKGPPGMWRR